jgi:hypothetical protein
MFEDRYARICWADLISETFLVPDFSATVWNRKQSKPEFSAICISSDEKKFPNRGFLDDHPSKTVQVHYFHLFRHLDAQNCAVIFFQMGSKAVNGSMTSVVLWISSRIVSWIVLNSSKQFDFCAISHLLTSTSCFLSIPVLMRYSIFTQFWHPILFRFALAPFVQHSVYLDVRQ